MTEKEISEKINNNFTGDILETIIFRDQVTLIVSPKKTHGVIGFLKKSPEFDMDSLNDLCGADYPDNPRGRNSVVYHLYSTRHKHRIRLKTYFPFDEEIDTVTDLYKTADWLERETYDMYGIRFRGHPDLRRILLPENWEGFPLRKEYPVFIPSEGGKYE